ncbi:MAG: hypothetical protein AAGG69_15535, partial [Pseudomonadota bacterium]
MSIYCAAGIKGADAQSAFELRGTSAPNPVVQPTISADDGEIDDSGASTGPVQLLTQAERNAARIEFATQGPASTDVFGDEDAETDEEVESPSAIESTLEDELSTGAVVRASAAEPVQTGVGAPLESPYEATGIRLGAVTIRPTLELGVTYSSGTSRTENAGPPVTVLSSETDSRALEAVLGADFEASYADTEITGSAGLTVPIGIDGGDADPISADFSAELIR